MLDDWNAVMVEHAMSAVEEAAFRKWLTVADPENLPREALDLLCAWWNENIA